MGYYFDSSGGCKLCDAMEGWYEEEPCPPHPNCNCRIGKPPDDAAVNFDWSYGGRTKRDPARPSEAFIVHVIVTVECYSGRKIIDSTEVKFEERESSQDIDEYFDAVLDRLDEAAAKLAGELGADCPPVPKGRGENVDDDYDFA